MLYLCFYYYHSMNEKEKIEKILDALLESTECDAIEWKLRDTVFNSQTIHHFRAFSVDGETHFDVEVSLNDSLTDISRSNYIFIYNNGFVNGRKYVYDCDKTHKIQKLIFEKYIKQKITTTQNTDETLDKVLNSIGDKSYMRDKKLESILEDDIPTKNESFFKKLFK